MLTFGSLFAGIGGMDLGFERAGMACKWQVEIDDYARRVLTKHWPDVRRHDDVRTFPPTDPDEWRVDVIAGGFPCQDISFAGSGAGLAGERSGLWFEYARIIGVLRPRFIVVENVAALLVRGIDAVLGTLADLGYDAEWSLLSACSMGAPHTRERVFIVAYRRQIGRDVPRECFDREHEVSPGHNAWQAATFSPEWRDVQRWIGEVVENGGGIVPASERSGMADGVPNRLERIAGCGNAVVPQVAEYIARRILAVQ